MLLYPINIKVEGKKCVVVGGGSVAERKTAGLVEAGAEVTVVAPKFCPQIKRLKEKGKIKITAREYRKSDLNGAFLVFCATDDKTVNRVIARHAREKGILVNAADDPDYCDFTLPAVVKKGGLTIAVATGGASPALSRHLREKLEKSIGDEYGELTSILGRLREIFKEENKDISELKNVFDSLMGFGILDLLAKKKYKQVQTLVKKVTGQTLNLPIGG